MAAKASHGDQDGVALVVLARYAVLGPSAPGLRQGRREDAAAQGAVGPVELRVGTSGLILEVHELVQASCMHVYTLSCMLMVARGSLLMYA